MTALVASLEKHPLLTGWCGSITTSAAYFITALHNLDLFFRVATGFLGFVTGVLTLLITWRKWREGQARRPTFDTRKLQ